jgi:hypothetical protein
MSKSGRIALTGSVTAALAAAVTAAGYDVVPDIEDEAERIRAQREQHDNMAAMGRGILRNMAAQIAPKSDWVHSDERMMNATLERVRKRLKALKNARMPLPTKGKQMGECNRTACQHAPALFWNRSTLAYYCASCARKINEANTGELGTAPLCKFVEVK